MLKIQNLKRPVRTAIFPDKIMKKKQTLNFLSLPREKFPLLLICVDRVVIVLQDQQIISVGFSCVFLGELFLYSYPLDPLIRRSNIRTDYF